MDNNIKAFFALIQSGLWEKDVSLLQYGIIDYNIIHQLSEEQSVTGIVAAGLEHVIDVKISKDIALVFVGNALQIEQRNALMNEFVSYLFSKIISFELSPVLLKGQGVAQCYERPLWRSPGDIDLLFSRCNYEVAKEQLSQLSTTEPKENKDSYEYCLDIQNWPVELHGSLYCMINREMDKLLETIQEETGNKESYRIWKNGQTEIALPSVNDDIVIVFTHILKHFFHGGIGLRQICDWCRLLWTFKDTLDLKLLEAYLLKMRVMTEWKAFGYLAVNYLGMPESALPFYSSNKCWSNKALKIIDYIITTGNFGHNRDYSYQSKYPPVSRRLITFWKQAIDSFVIMRVFPKDALISLGYYGINGMKNFLRR